MLDGFAVMVKFDRSRRVLRRRNLAGFCDLNASRTAGTGALPALEITDDRKEHEG